MKIKKIGTTLLKAACVVVPVAAVYIAYRSARDACNSAYEAGNNEVTETAKHDECTDEEEYEYNIHWTSPNACKGCLPDDHRINVSLDRHVCSADRDQCLTIARKYQGEKVAREASGEVLSYLINQGYRISDLHTNDF